VGHYGQSPCACGRVHAESECAVVIQQARQLSWTLAERSAPIRFLIRDRDQKLPTVLTTCFESTGSRVVCTPFRAPQGNGFAERFVRTARAECLDWVLILNQGQLERILEVFADHYNRHRPHRALSLAPPEARRQAVASASSGDARMVRRDRSAVSFTSTSWRRDVVFAPTRLT